MTNCHHFNHSLLAPPPLLPVPCSLAGLQSSCLSALATARMPTTRSEEYRFTDITPLLQQALVAPASAVTAAAADVATAVAAHPLSAAAAATVVVVDGVLDWKHSRLEGLPAGVYVGGLAGAPADVAAFSLVSGFFSRSSWAGSPAICGDLAL